MAAKKPFGGMTVNFASVGDWPISKIFPAGAMAPSEMTKKVWAFVKKNGLMKS